jgi:membrane protease YdiL (CAAX protease family)
MTVLRRSRPFLEVRDLKLRAGWVTAVTIVAAAVLMQGLLVLGREPARWIWQHGPADWQPRAWIFVTLAIAFQAVIGFAALQVMSRALPGADSHLRWPPGKTYVGLAVVIGIAMAIIMLVADYWPQLLLRVPSHDYPTNAPDAAGWLFAMAITGLAEETIFRGLLVGGLVVMIPGRLRIGALDLPIAAYVVAALFGLAHYGSFFHSPLHRAIAQQIYAFAWGLAYVWLMERSKSLLAPIVAHGLSDMIEVAAVIALARAWA